MIGLGLVEARWVDFQILQLLTWSTCCFACERVAIDVKQLEHRRSAGFTAWSLSKAGYSMRALKDAGFCIKDLWIPLETGTWPTSKTSNQPL